jgi:hypothetical protein
MRGLSAAGSNEPRQVRHEQLRLGSLDVRYGNDMDLELHFYSRSAGARLRFFHAGACLAHLILLSRIALNPKLDLGIGHDSYLEKPGKRPFFWALRFGAQPSNTVGLVRPAASCCLPSRKTLHPRNTSPSLREDRNPR